MKKLIVSVACLSVFGFSGAGMAAPPHGKATILHCGCVVADGAATMEYVQISVSSRARGHTHHAIGTLDSCFDGVDAFVELERTGADCNLEGTPIAGLGNCGDLAEPPMAGDTCGGEPTPVAQP